MLAGKTVAEAQAMSGADLAAPLGALPPVRIHCAQLVEGALRNALSGSDDAPPLTQEKGQKSSTLVEQLSSPTAAPGKVKIVFEK
jgi:nitrogen fixation NifU-like protein